MPRNSSNWTQRRRGEASSFAQLAASLREEGTSATGQPLIRPEPHPGQRALLESDHPRRLLIAHRRWGKDWACILDLRHRVGQWQQQPHRRQLSPAISIGVIYPTYPLAREFWLALKRMTPRPEVATINEGMPPRLTLTCGAETEVRTGSDPDMLVAAGYDLVILGRRPACPGRPG